jgi:hypothetical protein
LKINFCSIIEGLNNIFIETIQDSPNISFSPIFEFFEAILINELEKSISKQLTSLISSFLNHLFQLSNLSSISTKNLSIIFTFISKFCFIFT